MVCLLKYSPGHWCSHNIAQHPVLSTLRPKIILLALLILESYGSQTTSALFLFFCSAHVRRARAYFCVTINKNIPSTSSIPKSQTPLPTYWHGPVLLPLWWPHSWPHTDYLGSIAKSLLIFFFLFFICPVCHCFCFSILYKIDYLINKQEQWRVYHWGLTHPPSMCLPLS